MISLRDLELSDQFFHEPGVVCSLEKVEMTLSFHVNLLCLRIDLRYELKGSCVRTWFIFCSNKEGNGHFFNVFKMHKLNVFLSSNPVRSKFLESLRDRTLSPMNIRLHWHAFMADLPDTSSHTRIYAEVLADLFQVFVPIRPLGCINTMFLVEY